MSVDKEEINRIIEQLGDCSMNAEGAETLCGEASVALQNILFEFNKSNEYKQDFFDVFHCIIDGAGHKNEFAIKWRNEEINILQAVQGYVDELKETMVDQAGVKIMSISAKAWACVSPDWSGRWIHDGTVRERRKESQETIGSAWARQGETKMQGWKRAYRSGWRCVRVSLEVINPRALDAVHGVSSSS